MQQNIITLARRFLAALFSWLAIVILGLYLFSKLMPHLGISASLDMAFRSNLADQAVARLGNTFRISIHLNDKQ
ncbi:hypothetical protein SAMN04515620_13520 [Collimonas sp. OK607]|uniref:hypothetical protein n=1 Tax=Collimonas sp. OK607 TaxID=1798194 RepID=UPI0008DF011A|nr:hypothetical protein [Collimonas sp. OK607]SFB28440.1 hypothetical protein SAMN04515620_13520 [Collimonas sp. OK607]